MSLNRLYKLKKILNRFLLFIFIILALGDLIEIHLKVIYKIDLYDVRNPINKVNSSKNIKLGKGKIKSLQPVLNPFDLLYEKSELKPLSCKINIFFRHIVLPEYYKIFDIPIPRAPPLT